MRTHYTVLCISFKHASYLIHKILTESFAVTIYVMSLRTNNCMVVLHSNLQEYYCEQPKFTAIPELGKWQIQFSTKYNSFALYYLDQH